MRILYHHRTLSKDGQNVHIEELVSAFREAGHEVLVVGPKAHRNSKFGSDGGFLTHLRNALPRACGEVAELAYSVGALLRLWLAWRRFRPDALYERYNLFLLSGAWLSRITKIPFALEINAPLALERDRSGGLAMVALARRCENYVWRQASVVLPVTDALVLHLDQANVEKNRVQVVMNGINPLHFTTELHADDIRKKYGLSDKLVIGFAGFLRDWHGLPAVIDVMHDLAHRHDLHFLVVGDGPARKELMLHAKRSGLEDRITITGVIPRSEIPSYLAAFDIAVQPKATEYASPLKLFEYMAMGCAIMAPDQANIREVLTHGGNALLFTPDNLESFRTTLQSLVNDKLLRDKLGAAAARSIETQDLTWKGNVRRVTMALRKIQKVAA